MYGQLINPFIPEPQTSSLSFMFGVLFRKLRACELFSLSAGIDIVAFDSQRTPVGNHVTYDSPKDGYSTSLNRREDSSRAIS